MKFRWSDGHSFAVEFESLGQQGFAADALNALIDFRAKTGRKYHDGKTRTTKWNHAIAQLHIEAQPKNWCPLLATHPGIHPPLDNEILSAAWGQAIKFVNHSHALTGLVADIVETAFGNETT